MLGHLAANPDMTNMTKASQVAIVVALLALSGGARAESTQSSDADADAAMAAPVPCVSLVSNTLDLRILADASDIWAADAHASIVGSRDEVTLLVAVSSGKVPMSFSFETVDESVSILDARGNQLDLAPSSSLSPVSAMFTLVDDEPFSVIATSKPSDVSPTKPPGSNKAVLKPVSTCPRG